MKRLLASLVVGVSMLSCALVPPGVPVDQAEQAITAQGLLGHIRTLASDEFEGRGMASEGERRTLEYLTEQFRRAGLKPGHPDGGWRQAVPFVGVRSRTELTLTLNGQPIALKEPDDFWGGSVWQVPEVAIDDSELVFVGYGVVAPEYGWDDYKGVDVRGKTVVMLPNDPQVADPADPSRLDPTMFKGRAVTFYSHSDHKRAVARERGAMARLTLFEPGMFGVPTWKTAISTFGLEEFDLREPDGKRSELAAGAQISPEVAQRLFAASGLDLAALKQAARRPDFRPVALKAKASFRVRQTLRPIDSFNVVARVEGSDPAVKDEWIVYTAHWDHFGRDPTLAGDQVFNGALDNASGVAALLEVARAFARLRPAPRRSVLFVATTGEEHGLLGARHYARRPLYPLEKTLANLNIDVINVRGRTRDVALVGHGRSTLAERLVALAAARGRVATDDPLPELGLFYRSDHKEFAAAGVPAVWMRRGMDFVGQPADYGRRLVADYLANHYHKVSDEVGADWDLSGAQEDYRLYFRLGWEVAQADDWPRWTRGDEFEARRLQMLGGSVSR